MSVLLVTTADGTEVHIDLEPHHLERAVAQCQAAKWEGAITDWSVLSGEADTAAATPLNTGPPTPSGQQPGV